MRHDDQHEHVQNQAIARLALLVAAICAERGNHVMAQEAQAVAKPVETDEGQTPSPENSPEGKAFLAHIAKLNADREQLRTEAELRGHERPNEAPVVSEVDDAASGEAIDLTDSSRPPPQNTVEATTLEQLEQLRARVQPTPTALASSFAAVLLPPPPAVAPVPATTVEAAAGTETEETI